MNKKQILVIILVIVIITAGVIQFMYGEKGYSSRNNGEERLGEAVYVDNITGGQVITDGTGSAQNTGENGGAETANDYFTQARMEREAIRSRRKEELKELTSGNVSEEVSARAQQEYLDLIKRAEIEATIESLIKQRGIEDVVVIFGSTGTVDLVVKAESLSQSETAQISDIVMRHAGVEMKDIHIKNMK
ncbi:stage III sporulation protein AH [Thermoclostridium stercorarium subsp. stercorarium DSM 8532]|jgi:stage III sporulation protein AH|uniref:Stage III sporulation protein AH n=1 Tax=Thermoclostridium stercorarium (strain ATCC 35414 / DSM 8532 / NCIMB 11754) TaxID=1121335 RepID=L7VHP0_THES1|nr:SpoIIIAH-like family protein [Thermoclostridium stercorarium]AGC67560.1 stage III sporulation protein AH [Thermoclostridium stercorarium subsp. stercorarium DSM 8532]AGI38609.1 sporulation protein [Thermoclostridium stercorarium subsp. stercorarium DSM 8532]UZQ86145.1 SpoIIIAH-like family protein [Thermoclostridium stercorarium]